MRFKDRPAQVIELPPASLTLIALAFLLPLVMVAFADFG
jgi:hypothetical protein